MTEANATSVILSSSSMESGIRALARGGQGSRAADRLLTLIQSPDCSLSPSTVMAVLSTLGGLPDKAEAVIQALEEHGALQWEPHELAAAKNVMWRGLARQDPTRAYAVFEQVLKRKAALLEQGTLSTLVAELLKRGEAERAEEVLEWRDFLCGD